MATLATLVAAAISAGAPLVFATLGELVTERSGVLNLGVEGLMLLGALAGFWISLATGLPWLGVAGAALAGAALAAVHGLVCLTFLGNQVVSGLALTIAGTGLANYLGTPLVGKTAPGFGPVQLPLLSDIPMLGQALFSHDVLVYVSYALPFGVWFLLRRTRWGLSLEAAGQNPDAARAVGLDPVRARWLGVLLGGALCGVGGGYLSLSATHLWATGITAGRGWIAVALVVFAFWRPGRAVAGAWLFGGVMALQLRLQASGVGLPSSLLLMLPYAMTLLALIVASLRKRSVAGLAAPAALGVNVEPEG